MGAVAQPSGTVTLVFTDIEGSTRLLEELGTERYREALARHRDVVRAACARFSGYEVDYEGDAFFYAFQSAQDAVAAVSGFMAGLDGGPIRVRVGVHTGEPALDPPKYVGIDVHRAARVMAAAHGGQVVLSPSTVALLEPGSFALRELGQHRLKDLSAPIVLHQLLVDGLPDAFPPLKTLYRSNLPVPATPFLGREQELAEVTQRLLDPDTRLLTLTGPGGTGKTRLALQAAAEASHDYPDGITWVPLAPVRDAGLVSGTVAQALGVREQPGAPLNDTIAGALLDRRMLLVVDNCEHLRAAAAELVGRLVDACPTLVVVATSREPLSLHAERLLPVPTMVATDGRALFLERARAVRPDVHGNGEVDAICKILDQLPLAIELAAARTRSLSPAAILDRLDEPLRLLASRAGDVDERQRTLEATIAWSYLLLEPEERRALRALGVFAGGCTLEAAEHVAGADLDLLESLLDKSLLRHSIDDAGQDRYWMLESIRQYARARLEEAEEAGGVLARHRAAYVALARSLEPSRYGGSSHEEIARVRADRGNFRVALTGAIEDGDGSSALSLVRSLGDFWYQEGELHSGYEAATRALELPGGEPIDRAYAQGRMMQLAYDLGRPEDAQALLAAAEPVLREAGDLCALSLFIGQRGFGEATRGDPARGAADAERAIELARAARDRDLEMIAVHALAIALQARALSAPTEDDALVEQSLELLEHVLEWARTGGTAHDVSAVLDSVGLTRHLLGDHAQGLRDMQEALQVNPFPEYLGIVSLDNIGYAAIALGMPREGVMLLSASARQRRRLGIRLQTSDERHFRPAAEAAARTALGDEHVAEAMRTGEAMTLNDAIQLALSLDPDRTAEGAP